MNQRAVVEMALVSLLLLSVCLAEIYCQTTFPYVSFMGLTLANHSYVNLSTVRNDYDSAVHCHTDLSTCCSGNQGRHRGDWYFPDGTRLPFFGGTYEGRGAQRVYLHRITDTKPSGIYRCGIPTNAVHHTTTNSVRATVYVGLYEGNRGKYSLYAPHFFRSLLF